MSEVIRVAEHASLINAIKAKVQHSGRSAYLLPGKQLQETVNIGNYKLMKRGNYREFWDKTNI